MTWLHFKCLRSIVKVQSLETYDAYLSKIQISFTHDPKLFCNFVHDINRNSRIPGEMFYDDGDQRSIVYYKWFCRTFCFYLFGPHHPASQLQIILMFILTPLT